jgi:hypothetical protein
MKVLQSIGEFLINIVLTFIDLIISIFSVAISSVKALVSIISALPGQFVVFITAIIAVSVVYKLLSRGGSGE